MPTFIPRCRDEYHTPVADNWHGVATMCDVIGNMGSADTLKAFWEGRCRCPECQRMIVSTPGCLGLLTAQLFLVLVRESHKSQESQTKAKSRWLGSWAEGCLAEQEFYPEPKTPPYEVHPGFIDNPVETAAEVKLVVDLINQFLVALQKGRGDSKCPIT